MTRGELTLSHHAGGQYGYAPHQGYGQAPAGYGAQDPFAARYNNNGGPGGYQQPPQQQPQTRVYEPPVRSSGSAFVRPPVDPSAKPASVSLSIGGGAKTASLPKADPDAKPATVSLKIGGGGGASKPSAGASSSSAAGSAAGSSKAATPANSSKAATPNSSKPATPVAGKSASAAAGAPSAAAKKEEKVAAANAKKEEKAEAKKVEEAKKDAVEAEIQAVADAEALEDLYGGDGTCLTTILHSLAPRSLRIYRMCRLCPDTNLSARTDKEVKPHVNIVFIGHVDAGKSTMGGNILYLCGMVDKRTLEKYEREAKEAGRESWYLSWALDSTSQEREKVRFRSLLFSVERAFHPALHCIRGSSF